MNSVWIILVVILAIIIFAVKSKKPAPAASNNVELQEKKIEYKYKSKKLMTDNEFEFFNRIVQALPEYYVFPQVSLGAFLQGDSPDPKERNSIRMTFAQKMADYVIYNQQQKIIAIIELDDKTHIQEKDEKRDAMLKQAGYKIIRFQSKAKPGIEEIKKAVG